MSESEKSDRSDGGRDEVLFNTFVDVEQETWNRASGIRAEEFEPNKLGRLRQWLLQFGLAGDEKGTLKLQAGTEPSVTIGSYADIEKTRSGDKRYVTTRERFRIISAPERIDGDMIQCKALRLERSEYIAAQNVRQVRTLLIVSAFNLLAVALIGACPLVESCDSSRRGAHRRHRRR